MSAVRVYNRKLHGQKFGKLTVIDSELVLDANKKQRRYWNCICDCGRYKKAREDAIVSGVATRCYECSKNQPRGKDHGQYNGFEGIQTDNITKRKIAAKKKGLPFDVSFEFLWSLYLEQEGKCALTGIPIKFYDQDKTVRENKKLRTQTASLDRINSSLGYIESNVQWLHKDINKMKLDHDQGYFINLCRLIKDNHIYIPEPTTEDYIFDKCKVIPKDGRGYKSRRGYKLISKNYMTQLRRGAVLRGLEFDITIQDVWELYLSQGAKCKLSGIEVYFGYKVSSHWELKASVDRIDSSKGYNNDNIQILHVDINKMKLNHTQDKFIELASLVADYTKSRTSES